MKKSIKIISLLISCALAVMCGKSGADPRNAYHYGEDYLTIDDIDPDKSELVPRGLPTYNQEKNRITVQYNYASKSEGVPRVVDEYLARLEIRYDFESVNLPEDQNYKKDIFKTWIEPRVRPIKDDYCAYRREIGMGPGPSWYGYIYIRETPSITADKTLFGREAGSPLVDLFYLYGSERILKEGDGFRLIGLGGDTMAYSEARRLDRLAPGTLWPLLSVLSSTTFPEELKNHEEVKLTITFPVVFEHFWKYALRMAEEGSAEEEFVNVDLSMTVSLNYLEDGI